MSALTLKLIILLIPGAIATILFGKLVLHKEWSSFKFVLYSTLFGVSAYVITQVVINSINYSFGSKISDLDIWQSLAITNEIPYQEVFYASISASLISLLVVFIENKRLLNRFASFIRISNKYGDDNLYSMFLSSENLDFVYVRDIENQLTYHGWVKSFSENDLISELLLAEVGVYNYSDSALLYEVDELYLSLNKNKIIIEKAGVIRDGEETAKTK